MGDERGFKIVAEGGVEIVLMGGVGEIGVEIGGRKDDFVFGLVLGGHAGDVAIGKRRMR